MIHASNERATESVLFAGMCALVRETLQRQNLQLLCNERSVLSSFVNLQMIITSLGSFISLKQLAAYVKGKQDDAPPHLNLSVRDWSNITVPNQWIGRKDPPDKACTAWPPRSCDLTPFDFYLRVFIKDCVYVPSLPSDLSDERHMIEAAFARISSDTLKKVWDELAYRLGWRRVTNGAPIEHL
ncbi:DUF4817 domain-containing protein [Trichonephila clavipes]|uniref:DUF4817 domain-containing protein n=1 Tax=Trichonephila clavipes TaxID=2585209 RepID=A0A8X6VP54_TRICX|nr:DUF4817 domain-containing protein [Trichonephila clavipes]